MSASTIISFECDQCNKTYCNISSLNAHKKSSKTCGSEKYPCEYCDKIFTSKQSLQYHSGPCSTEHKIRLDAEDYKQKFLEKDAELAQKESEYKEEIAQKDAEILQKETEYKEEIGKLKTVVETMEKIMTTKQKRSIQKVTINNNIINNNQQINVSIFYSQPEVQRMVIENFTEEDMILGEKGVAAFITRMFGLSQDKKKSYTCSDKSRQFFLFSQIEVDGAMT